MSDPHDDDSSMEMSSSEYADDTPAAPTQYTDAQQGSQEQFFLTIAKHAYHCLQELKLKLDKTTFFPAIRGLLQEGLYQDSDAMPLLNRINPIKEDLEGLEIPSELLLAIDDFTDLEDEDLNYRKHVKENLAPVVYENIPFHILNSVPNYPSVSNSSRTLQFALVPKQAIGAPKSLKSKAKFGTTVMSINEIAFEDEEFEDPAGNKITNLRKAKRVRIMAETAGGGSHRPTQPERNHIYPCSRTQSSQQDDSMVEIKLPDEDEFLADLVEEELHISLKPIDKEKYPDSTPHPKRETAGNVTKTRLDRDAAPVSDINEIFQIMAQKLTKDGRFEEACKQFADCGLRVFTMCSGTESPLLALRLLGDALTQQGISDFPVTHLGSAEIVPFKQAYIQRNFNPSVLFRDVTEFVDKDNRPHTAYGGTASQPEGAHVLVAGSSCVDYSTLNSRPKKFGQKGQSYDTLQGIRGYAENYRPAIIVLENVKGAPWLKIQGFFAEIDYYGVVLVVDTKDFYLPQTRQRGYMVAFDRLRAFEIGLDLEDAAKILVDTLSSLAQRASSPYTDFIFADDDPELRDFERVLAKLERNSGLDAKVSDWSKCRIRYSEFRTKERLGIAKPLTKWRNNGKCTFLDYAWIFWASIQRERIWDTLDINFLFFVAKRDFDMNFKSKWIDLSQNVDRNNDNTPWGIVGCVTPSGMPFDTRRGGPVFGKEVLALQGIPAQNLSLNKESSVQLQDLAGNAMSTTVVGAVLAAAITASLKCASIPSSDDEEAMEIDSVSMFKSIMDNSSAVEEQRSFLESRPGASSVKQLVAACKTPLKSQPIPVRLSDYPTKLTELSVNARLALQLCRCEGLSSTKPQTFKICQVCGHTACKDCAGNPTHRYRGLKPSFVQDRKDPDAVREELNKSLPPLLRFSIVDDLKSDLVDKLAAEVKNFDEHKWQSRDAQACKKNITAQAYKISSEDLNKYKAAVAEALNSTVYLQSIKHGQMWRAVYVSPSASLELRIFQQHNHGESSHGFSDISSLASAWYLYALPARAEPAQCWLRDILKRPIARLRLTEKTFFEGQWEIWSPSMPVIDLNIRGKKETSSWEKKIGIRDDKYRDLMTFAELTITPKTTSSSNSGLSSDEKRIRSEIGGRYQLEQSCGAANGSLYRKDSKLAGGKMSVFFFLDTKNIGNAVLDRFVFAGIHERLPLGVDRHVIAEMERGWRPSTQKISSTGSTFTCRLIDCWTPTDDLRFDPGKDIPHLDCYTPTTSTDYVTSSTDCGTMSTLAVAKLPEMESPQSKLWKPDYQYPVDMIGRSGTLHQYQWLLGQLHKVLPLGEHTIELDSKPDACPCIPQLPELQWLISRKINSKQVIIKPFEDEEAATRYERELKERPFPFIAIVHWYGKDGCLELQANIPTLIHRVCRQLIITDKSTTLKWRLIRTTITEMPPRFPEICLSEDSNGPVWPQNDAAYALLPNVEKPNNFVTRKMWIGQRQTLAWMRKMETGHTDWKEWALEDVSLPALGLSLQVEASSSIVIRGGVVADEVGAGKTTTSLALIARDMEDYSASHAPSLTLPSGRIPSKATLILVPANLIPQWKSEVMECFGVGTPGRPNVVLVVISKAQDLQNLTISQLKEADIVLAPWNMFEDSKYWSSMRELCMIANVPETPGRGFQQWLDNATADLQDLATNSSGCTDKKTFWHHRENRAQEKRKIYSKFHAFRQIDGTTSAEYKQKISETLDPTKVQASYPVSAEHITGLIDSDFDNLKNVSKKHITPLLHFFEFQRLMVDEFTYLEGKSLLAILKLESKRRWMLSGTPPLTTFDSVNTIAKLLGTKITVENEKDGVFSFAKTKINAKNDKSYAEEFREQTLIRSASWLRTRNEKAQEFVATFIHKRKAPPAIVKEKIHYVGVDMSVAESILMLRAYHRLMRQTIKFKGTQKVPGDSLLEDKRLFNALEQAPNAEAGLLCCPADLLDDLVLERDNLRSRDMCREIISKRTTDIENLLKEIYVALREAFYLWDVDGLTTSPKKPPHAPTDLTHFGTYLSGIKDSIYGDVSVQNILMNLVITANRLAKIPSVLFSKGKGSRCATGRHSMPKFDKEVTETLPALRKELKERAADLDDMTRNLTEYIQQARLLRRIGEIVEGERTNFNCSGCKKGKPINSLRILGLCGHFSCNHCLKNSSSFDDNPIGCVVAGCAAPATNSSIPAKLFAERRSEVVSPSGTKISELLNKIKEIQASTPDEMILIFVQFEAIRRQLLAALASHDTKCEDACTNAEKVINGLKRKPKDPNSLPPVLLLKIDSADAAGWNLQEYNHVMFVSPFQVKTKADYNATMTQAVGRALRYGQKNDVHVYHFVWYHSAEVNILQKMEGKRFVRLEDGTCDLVAHEVAGAKEDLRGPSLAKVNAFGAGVDFAAAEGSNDDDDVEFGEEEEEDVEAEEASEVNEEEDDDDDDEEEEE